MLRSNTKQHASSMKNRSDNLLTRLLTADICCRDCGDKYGSYSVGCSSTWQAECPICGETKGCTEVRDWGYLTKGIKAEKAKIAGQSIEVANYMKCQEELTNRDDAIAYMSSVGPIMDDGELEDALTASYEVGEITCKFTEEEVGFLNECLDTIQGFHGTLQPGSFVKEDVDLFESIEHKIITLYDDYCIKYELSPALKAYNKKYGTWGSENDEEMKRWEGFRDAFVMLHGVNND